MKRFLILGALLAIAAVSANPSPVIDDIDTQVDGVDIVAEKDRLLAFSFEARPGPGGNSIQVGELLFEGATSSFTIPAQGRSGDRFDFVISAKERNLVVGNWNVYGIAVDATGRTNQSAPHALVVNATDVPAFTLQINGKTEANAGEILVSTTKSPIVTIGPDGQDYLIQETRWRTGGLWRDLQNNILFARDFDAQSGNLQVQVFDRLGRISTYSAAYSVDQVAPDIQVMQPARLFSTIENTIQFSSNETANVTYSFNGGTGGFRIAAGTTFDEKFEVVQPGIYPLVYSARDDLGNVGDGVVNMQFVRPTTEVSLKGVSVDGVEMIPNATVTNVLRGDSIDFAIIWQQVDGAAPVMANGTIHGEELLAETAFVLPKSGEFKWEKSFELAPGMHQLLINTTISSTYNQTIDLLESMTVDVEVFIGKVIFGDKTYFIRANSQGFPSEAVLGDEVFQLALDEDSLTPKYIVVGSDGAYWNSGEVITTISEQQGEEKKETPFGAILVPLALLGVAVRRR